MGQTTIEWTRGDDGSPGHTVNPIRARNRETGSVGHFCEKVSPGCAHCYASQFNLRVRPQKNGAIGTGLDFLPINRERVELFLDEAKLKDVLRRQKPTRYFWCDMTDLFGDFVPDEMVDRCFATMALTSRHTHQVLTKRPERMLAYMRGLSRGYGRLDYAARSLGWTLKFNELPLVPWPIPSVWLGVSAEDQKRWDERSAFLRETPAVVRFCSFEPLLSAIELPTDAGDWLHWGIVGGESGHGARPMHPDWARSLRDQCQAAGVAYFFKQWGEWGPLAGELHVKEYSKAIRTDDWREVHKHKLLNFPTGEYSTEDLPIDAMPFKGREYVKRVGKKAAGRELDGKVWDEFPQPERVTA